MSSWNESCSGQAPDARAGGSEAGDRLIAAADKGTLFLDQLADASPGLQAKLLRFLEDREVRPVGATAGRRLDVMIIAAAHAVDVEDGVLRRLGSDLLARFGTEPVTIPPLRHCMEDLAGLVAHFSSRLGAACVFDATARRAMYCYGWPHNVRELEKVVDRVVASAAGGRIGLGHLPAAIREALRTGPPIEASRRRQRGAPSPGELRALLAEHDGNVAAVARTLDRQWNVVRRWVLKHDLLPACAGRSASG